MKKYAIIVAGGTGLRMNSETPKQFLALKGIPILMRTIDAFAKSAAQPEIILSLNVDFHHQWEKLCREFTYTTPHRVVKGGTTRFHSVKNGLKQVEKDSLVAIHDAVRPLVDEEVIMNAYAVAEEKGNAVVAVPSKESLRRKFADSTEAVRREDYYIVQTPQVFSSTILFQAYQQEFRNEFTDDASVVERTGININLVEGSYRNIKITFPEDLLMAEALIR